MTLRNVKTREGYEHWDKLCAIPRYGFIHSPDNSRVLKAEGIGNWIDMHAAQEVVDAAQDEVNGLRAEKAELLEALEAIEEAARQVMAGEMATSSIMLERLKAQAAIAKAKGERHE